MLSDIPSEIVIGSFSLVGVLTGYVWNSQSLRIKKLEDFESLCPFPILRQDIAQMKTDIDWIKKYLIKN